MRAFRALGLMAGVALLAFVPSTQPSPLTVSHYRSNGKLMLLPVRVNGLKLWFTVDSGARHTVIDSAAAKRLGLRIVSADRDRGVGRGTVLREHAAPLNVSVLGVHLHVEDPWVLNLSGTGTALQQDGLLGADFFTAYVVSIDPIERTFTVYDPKGFHYVGNGARIPISITNNRFFMKMKLSLANGVSATHNVRIDTGSEDAVSDDLIKQSPERRKSVQGVGLGQSYVDYSGVFSSVQIGAYVIKDAWGPSNPAPAVGMEILRRFTMTFDAPQRTLYLESNARLNDSVPSPPPAST
jgi:hypothetical protein